MPKSVLHTGSYGKEYTDELEAGCNSQEESFLVSWEAVPSLLPITWVTHIQPPKETSAPKEGLCGEGRHLAKGIGRNSLTLTPIITYFQLKCSERSRKLALDGLEPLSPSSFQFGWGRPRKEKRRQLSLWNKWKAWGLRGQFWTGLSKLDFSMFWHGQVKEVSTCFLMVSSNFRVFMWITTNNRVLPKEEAFQKLVKVILKLHLIISSPMLVPWEQKACQ